MDWNASEYLKFRNERTQPAVDLINRINHPCPEKIIDIGCGPGNSTSVLSARFTGARVLGVDNSENMLAKAREDYPGLDFGYCDVGGDLSGLGNDFDIVFSNACLQWIPNHGELLGRLAELLREGGFLAVQIPYNEHEPIQTIIREVAFSSRWADYFPRPRVFHTLTAGEYFDILSEIFPRFDIWETVYYHAMKSHGDIMEWYRGTGMKPYLDALANDERAGFEEDVYNHVAASYPKQRNGEIIFRFPRLFFIAGR